jgi:hypothetical protein
VVLAPPILFVLAWVFVLLGVTAPGADGDPPFDENAIRWILFLAAGWTSIGAFLAHTIFARKTAEGIGWTTNDFQYEVGFANLGIGVACLVASYQDVPEAWIIGATAVSVFYALAGINHIVGIVREKNLAPGNSLILLADFGVPISLWILLLNGNFV